MKYFSIFDKKAEVFGQLYPSQTLGTGERSFKEAISNPDSPYSKFPEDFALYLICEFNDESGEVIPIPPQLVAEASSLVG